jgi:hypothetical protein
VGIKKIDLTDVCKKISQEYLAKNYVYKGKNAVPTHWLKLPYQKVAIQYLPCNTDINDATRILFPGEVVQRIAKELNIPVTDLIRV